MGKKTKRLYDRMQYGINAKDSKAAALQAKADALEQSSASKGKTAGKGKKNKADNSGSIATGGTATKKPRKK